MDLKCSHIGSYPKEAEGDLKTAEKKVKCQWKQKQILKCSAAGFGDGVKTQREQGIQLLKLDKARKEMLP